MQKIGLLAGALSRICVIRLRPVTVPVVAGSTRDTRAVDASQEQRIVDLAVLFDPPPPPTLKGPRLAIEGELEGALGMAVDLVALNDAPVEVRTRNEAFDLEPILARYRAARECP